MTIRALALELYKAQQQVHTLQTRLQNASLAERDQLRRELQQAEATCRQLRRIIDAEKEPSPLRGSFTRR